MIKRSTDLDFAQVSFVKQEKEKGKQKLTCLNGLSFGKKQPIVFPYASQVEKCMRRLLFFEQYFT